jgi:hypothetical protein
MKKYLLFFLLAAFASLQVMAQFKSGQGTAYYKIIEQ